MEACAVGRKACAVLSLPAGGQLPLEQVGIPEDSGRGGRCKRVGSGVTGRKESKSGPEEGRDGGEGHSITFPHS